MVQRQAQMVCDQIRSLFTRFIQMGVDQDSIKMDVLLPFPFCLFHPLVDAFFRIRTAAFKAISKFLQ